MLIDLRYHLITLVAVFLALAVGISVGSSFLVGSSIERRVTKGLEQELGKLIAENREQQHDIRLLEERLKKNAEFDRAAAPALIEGLLSWHNVAIIQTGDYSEATQSAKSALEHAGAKVVSVTTLSNLDTESAWKRADRAMELITGEADPKNRVGRMLEILADCVVNGSNPEAMDVLEDKALLSKAGDYDRHIPNVVLVGGDKQKGSNRARHVDLALIERLETAGAVRVVGVEPLDAVTSNVPEYHRKSIPTVDNIDQPMGQVALVFALAGDDGSFGVKKSADRVVPASLESGEWHRRPRR